MNYFEGGKSGIRNPELFDSGGLDHRFTENVCQPYFFQGKGKGALSFLVRYGRYHGLEARSGHGSPPAEATRPHRRGTACPLRRNIEVNNSAWHPPLSLWC